MSKHLLCAIISFVASSCFFASCGSSNPNAGDLRTDSVYINRTEHLYGDTAMPACNLIISHTWIADADEPALRDSLNHMLQLNAFGNEYAYMPVQEAMERYGNDYVTNFRKDYEPFYAKEYMAYAQSHDGQAADGSYTPSAWFNFFQKIETRTVFYHKHLLTFSIYHEEYTGGAHGFYGTDFLNIDLRTLKTITLDDLLQDGYEEELTALIEQQLMQDNNVGSLEELYDMGYGTTGNIAPIDNFYLTPSGITFHYNIYEIAPYVIGPTEVTVGFDKIEALLRDDYMIVEELKTANKGD